MGLKNIWSKVFKGMNLRERTIRKEIMVALLLVAVIPASMFNAYFTRQVSTSTHEKVDIYNNEIMRQMSARLEELIQGIDLARELALEVAVMLDFFDDYQSKTNVEKLEINRRVDDRLRYIRRSFPVISDIYLISSSGDIFSSLLETDKEKLSNKKWIRSLSGQSGKAIIIGPHDADYYITGNHSLKVYSFISSVISTNNAANNGMLQIDIKYDAVREIFENDVLIYDNSFVLCDSDDNTIYTSENYSDSLGKDFLIKQQELFNSWILTGLFSKQIAVKQIRTIWVSFLVTMVGLVVVLILISYILSARMLKPLTNIISLMKNFTDVNMDMDIAYSKNTDINVLVKSFKKMISEIRNLVDIVIKKEKEKVKAQILAFQSQINPHYLYNTLETIRIMAYNSKAYDVEDVIKALAYNFRYCINTENVVVQLEEELFHVSNYMKIQKYRFNNKISFKHNISGGLCSCRVLKFILQPLVENSVYHGLVNKSSKNMINIVVSTENNILKIKLYDNGVGIEKDVLADINYRLSYSPINTAPIITNKSDKSKKSIGLFNVNNRIKLYYGDDYGVEVKSWVGIGTVVIITIPLLNDA